MSCVTGSSGGVPQKNCRWDSEWGQSLLFGSPRFWRMQFSHLRLQSFYLGARRKSSINLCSHHSAASTAPSSLFIWFRLFFRTGTCPGWFCASSHGSLSGESHSLGALALRGWCFFPRVVARVIFPVLSWKNNFFLVPLIYVVGPSL